MASLPRTENPFAPASSAPGAAHLVRGLGPFAATMLIVGSVIGSGIFVAPSLMATYLASPGLLMGLWILGGLLTLSGALACAELAAAFPRAGGQYVFLSEAFGPLWGFLYGWTFLLAINTGFIAAVGVAFAIYLGVFIPSISETRVLFSLAGKSFSTAQAVGLVVIAALTWLNVRGLREGAIVQNLFTIAKISAVAVLVVMALALAGGSLSHFSPIASTQLGPEGLKLGLFAAIAVAMSKALFAYDAWNSVTFAAEEIKDPQKNMPRALILGTLLITAVYCSAVAVYLYMVPIGEMGSVTGNRIAAETSRRLMGPAGETFIAIAIMVSTFGCVNGLILSGARVVYAMARDRLFFPSAAAVHPTHRTPANALMLQGAIAAVLTLTGSYSDLLTLTAFSSLMFNVLCVVGLFVLRARRPELPRPFRAWGYPLLPALYVAVALFFLCYILIGDPRNSGLGLVLTAVGLPAYVYWNAGRPAAQRLEA
ncbi:Serine/threonine exchanger SteT [Phycisphaerae bacterium RAS1]|nr:Serine/threonine exchanger SteT [Phycisphaerae bacterium RAS1]